MIMQLDEQPFDLGSSTNVKAVDRFAVHEVPDQITLAFSKDGHKLVFIDNKVRNCHRLMLRSRAEHKSSRGA